MTSRRASRCVALVALVLAGCKTTPPPAPPPAPPAFSRAEALQGLERMRAALMAQNASARVGVVVEVLSDRAYARLAEIDAAEFPDGSTVLIVDPRGTKVADGVVDAVYADQRLADVTFANATRRPNPGDFAVRFTDVRPGGATMMTPPPAEPQPGVVVTEGETMTPPPAEARPAETPTESPPPAETMPE